MISDTKTRLLETAATLFADHGYRGASVRHICDLARANPGAVSYHFGGKNQLYRTVLRRAATYLAAMPTVDPEPSEDPPPLSISEVVERIVDRVEASPTETRLLLRDLADGGGVAVEALEPILRTARRELELSLEDRNPSERGLAAREVFIDLAAPLFLLTAAWPVLQRALDLEPDQRRSLVNAACRRALESVIVDVS